MDPVVKAFALRQVEFALDAYFDPHAFDQERVLNNAIAHQCVPFLTAFFRQKGWPLPRNFRIWNRDSAARNLLYSMLLNQLTTSFDFPWLVLKGIPLGEFLYGHAMWRQSTDIDVLLDIEDLPRAIEKLEEEGFILERKVRPWAYNQVPLRHEKHHATIELHWDLSLPYLPSPSTKGILDRSVEIYCQSTSSSLRMLDPLSLFYNLVLHFHQHFSFIKGGIDLVSWLSRFSIEEGLEFAEKHGIRKLAEIAVATVYIRGWKSEYFPYLESNELKFLRQRVNINGAFSFRGESDLRTYWKQMQNALFLDCEPLRTDALVQSLLFGPHRFSDTFVKMLEG